MAMENATSKQETNTFGGDRRSFLSTKMKTKLVLWAQSRPTLVMGTRREERKKEGTGTLDISQGM